MSETRSRSVNKIRNITPEEQRLWTVIAIGGMVGGLAIGLLIGEARSDNVVTFQSTDCKEYSLDEPGEYADEVAVEAGANQSGEVSSAIHSTLDSRGYGRVEICHAGDNWVVTDLDGSAG